ncbi:V-type proton ATPase subunit C-like isoform X8 [Camellia sinensis]|uniref:V-type proton ATPase subunit C-like isoform X8 n=1 Tax=Camellia sinensis TaxID=4442 RepID=UPI00103648DF|nr:V-type proton ATPase subunit C-like isoform X8 [Camellia sinensis]
MEFMFKLPRLKMNLKFVQGQSTPSIATQSSNLAVCDLSNLVKPQDIIITEHLTTLLAIVPKYSQKDWLSSYKTLTAYVVPRSSTKLHEDNEYALYTVTLFSRDADNFRTKARDRGFQVFSSWMHFCAVCVFTESILRYGLPPSFLLSIVLAPSVKSEKKARSILEELCDSANRWS